MRDVTFLVVDDDLVDVKTLERAFRRNGLGNRIVVAEDGVEALELLRGENGREPLEKPFVILLDLNLPRMHGIEFLRTLRLDPLLSSSVVFVLTASDADRDRQAAYSQHAAGYLVKTSAEDGIERMAAMLSSYQQVVCLP